MLKRFVLITLFVLIVLPLIQLAYEAPKFVLEVNMFMGSLSATIALGLFYLKIFHDKYEKKHELKNLWRLQFEMIGRNSRPPIFESLENLLENFQSVNNLVMDAYGSKFYTEYLEQIRHSLHVLRHERDNYDSNRSMADSTLSGLKMLIDGI